MLEIFMLINTCRTIPAGSVRNILRSTACGGYSLYLSKHSMLYCSFWLWHFACFLTELHESCLFVNSWSLSRTDSLRLDHSWSLNKELQLHLDGSMNCTIFFSSLKILEKHIFMSTVDVYSLSIYINAFPCRTQAFLEILKCVFCPIFVQHVSFSILNIREKRVSWWSSLVFPQFFFFFSSVRGISAFHSPKWFTLHLFQYVLAETLQVTL